MIDRNLLAGDGHAAVLFVVRATGNCEQVSQRDCMRRARQAAGPARPPSHLSLHRIEQAASSGGFIGVRGE